ncbi:LuxR C-terminal-related transcriptional regulator [Streptomyces echinatus]|uniref:DNA-binding CsgD family transcriptional regulator n=1 Tax=Streptomyces echinatus TaxID=67293 RepID=A0A7W9Q2I4_9ACTN|nr:LuxR C-terminal-related transcriptional regulator [Streptomyces echinatus]MBB5932350.1 DNA-binding CsgD family transcriptional regulator [Streptomyces echinatus]
MNPLTARQLDVLKRIAEGQPWARIGSDLGISINGVGSINKQILAKLGATSAAHAVFLGCRAGLLDGRPQRHGDHAGYTAHLRRHETPCDDCAKGEIAYRAARRSNRRQTSQETAA